MATTGREARELSMRLRLLLASPDYRRRWERHLRQRRRVEISQAAVARVIAEYLIETGERPYDTVDLDRQLKDRVGRALGGRSLSASTLQWIIEAFDISESDADQLWGLFRPPSADVVRTNSYRNVAIHELHTIGRDGLPESHRTLQVIRAGDQPISHYQYRFDTDTASVEVLRGGTAGPVYDSGDGLSAVDITFSRPLAAGQTASLEYLTRFHYQDPPPPELRRGAARRIDILELRVQFHPERLPARLYWARWDQLDGPPAAQEEEPLDPEHAIHRYLDHVEAVIVGFTWEW